MSNDPAENVRSGLFLLKRAMTAFVNGKLRNKYRQEWWEKGIVNYLTPEMLGELGDSGKSIPDQFQMLDVQNPLNVIKGNWDSVFKGVLKPGAYRYVRELRYIRNDVAHERTFSVEDALGDIRTMREFVSLLGAVEAEELRKLEKEISGRIVEPTNHDQDRRCLERLIGKHVTTEKGNEFHVYEVNDWQVKYDPVRTSNPGFYWSYISSVTLLTDRIQKGARTPLFANDIGDLYKELGISADEGLTTQYMHGMLCAMGIIHHERAGKVLESCTEICPRFVAKKSEKS